MIQIHMTSTFKFYDNSVSVDCRCGWSQTVPPSLDAVELARELGDKHLAEFNN